MSAGGRVSSRISLYGLSRLCKSGKLCILDKQFVWLSQNNVFWEKVILLWSLIMRLFVVVEIFLAPINKRLMTLHTITCHVMSHTEYGDLVADVTLGCLMSRWLLPAVQSPVPGVMWHWADLALAEWCRGSVEARAQTPEFGLVRTESVTGSASGGCVWSTRVQPDSPHRQETSLEGWGCYPPNLNIMALNNISCTLTNIARTTRQFKQSHVMS